jgi:cyclopropane-fatty-acyl-phospholipid synthase
MPDVTRAGRSRTATPTAAMQGAGFYNRNSALQAPDPYWAAYEQSGDAAQLGQVWANTMRAANGTGFVAGLDPAHDAVAVLDAVTERLATRIAADPQQSRSWNVIAIIEMAAL